MSLMSGFVGLLTFKRLRRDTLALLSWHLAGGASNYVTLLPAQVGKVTQVNARAAARLRDPEPLLLQSRLAFPFLLSMSSLRGDCSSDLPTSRGLILYRPFDQLTIYH